MHGLPKWLTVLLLVIAGVVMSVMNVGGSLPLVRFKEGEAYQLPVGMLVVAAGVLVAIFWRPRTRVVVTETETTYGGFGGGGAMEARTTSRTTTTDKQFRGPLD